MEKKLFVLFFCSFLFSYGLNAQQMINNDLSLGDYTNNTGWGKKLIFKGAYWNEASTYIARYAINSTNKTELRMNIGTHWSGNNKFSVGNVPWDRPNAWRHLLVVTDQGRVGIGGVENPANALDVNGTIRAKEVIVETGWADFVFKPEYELPSLSDVEMHIKENGHLPGIPTEKEVLENGVGLGEMNVKLLQKVEELTLYIIQQNKRIEALENELK